MKDEELSQYILTVDENYYRFWNNGSKNFHPIAEYEIQKGLDIPGVISWLRICRLLYSSEGVMRGIVLSYRDGEHRRRTVTVSVNNEKKLRVTSECREISDFIFRIAIKKNDVK
ncbi:MAG: hypothetical protein IKW90_12125 [Lachnospiraceae bacterium]|nr:hypothetical protein [Lachnospiraceae bacterium]